MLALHPACYVSLFGSTISRSHGFCRFGLQTVISKDTPQLITERANTVWAGPVSALWWVPLPAYATDVKPAACSNGHAVQWIWMIVRWGHGDFMRTRYQQRRFSASLQVICRTVVIHWPMNEDARIDHCPYASIFRIHKARLIVH